MPTSPQAALVNTPSPEVNNNPDSRQLQTRRDGSFRWIALAVVVGALVAMAFVNFFAR
jgi:hypothetical protein